MEHGLRDERRVWTHLIGREDAIDVHSWGAFVSVLDYRGMGHAVSQGNHSLRRAEAGGRTWKDMVIVLDRRPRQDTPFLAIYAPLLAVALA